MSTLRDEFEEQAVKEGLDVTRSLNSNGVSCYHKGETVLRWLSWVEEHIQRNGLKSLNFKNNGGV